MHEENRVCLSGAQALARGAAAAGVSVVTGYPGSPATSVVEAILSSTHPDQVQVEWTSNEKAAIEVALGASLGGARALLCVKGVGLNIALDPLMAFNLSGCNAGLVVLVGDDPGGWGSQNEQDSRALGLAAELPLLEPCTVANAQRAMYQAFALSEELGVPVLVRVTHALTAAQGVLSSLAEPALGIPPLFWREWMRWIVLPVNVVSRHRRLLDQLHALRDRFARSPLNRQCGAGAVGIVAAGFMWQKLVDLLGDPVPEALRLLGLGTFHPLPEAWVVDWMRPLASVLVLEEGAPWVERAVRAAAQAAHLSLPIYGRDSGHVTPAGELLAPQIAQALAQVLPGLHLPVPDQAERAMPSRAPLCEGCPYIPTFDALVALMDRRGGRDRFIVVGDPGCMVRAQLPPHSLLDVKNSLGSAIGMAAGIALGQGRASPHAARHVIALSGDSGFLHSGLNGLIDAVRLDVPLLVVLLDNGTTALSGGQPHPANVVNARGQARPAVDLVSLVRAAGAGQVAVVDLDRGHDVQPALEAGLSAGGVAVVIARGRCPRYPTAGAAQA